MRRSIYCLIGLFLFQIGASLSASAQSATQTCPAISVTCPDTVDEGTNPTYKATVTGADPNLKLSYKWTVSEGATIVSGQGTPTVVIRMQPGITNTTTVEVDGLAPGCPNKASCSVISCRLEPARLFDSYTKLPFNKETARLKMFASALLNEPGAQGYIIVYAGRKDNAGSATSHAERLRNYLVKEYDMENGRIVIVDGGYREIMAVELFIAPTGSTPPTATPTINPDGTQDN